MDNTVQKIPTQDCVGCKLCANLCPEGAISFYERKDGFLFPRVDDQKCIRCGQCLRKCIANRERTKPISPNDMSSAYAAWAVDDRIRMNSTSGGAYHAMAKHVLDDGGFLCAAAFTEGYRGLAHIVGNDEATLLKTMRSKYFQSDMGTVYDDVKRIAESGERVLFVGCPCQTEAVRVYLGKDYDNVLLCDFICRGVNSQKAYRSFLKGMEEKYKSRISTVHFKNKSKGWTHLTTHLTFENGKEYYGTRAFDPWINGYIVGHFYMRESCYHCRYTNTKRYGDITIGDFWGYAGNVGNEDFQGVSCMIANTDKGHAFIKQLSDELTIMPAKLEDIIKGNQCLDGSQLEISPQRDEFFDQCEEERFDKLVYRLLGWDWKRVFKRKIKSSIITMKNRAKTAGASELTAMIVNHMEDIKNV